MRIRLAKRTDLASLASMDHDPGGWGYEQFLTHCLNVGVVKVLEDNDVPLGWIAFHVANGTLVVDRFILTDNKDFLPLAAQSLIRHILKYKRKVDVSISDGHLDVVQLLLAEGFSHTVIRDYYGPHEDAIALCKTPPGPTG